MVTVLPVTVFVMVEVWPSNFIVQFLTSRGRRNAASVARKSWVGWTATEYLSAKDVPTASPRRSAIVANSLVFMFLSLVDEWQRPTQNAATPGQGCEDPSETLNRRWLVGPNSLL